MDTMANPKRDTIDEMMPVSGEDLMRVRRSMLACSDACVCVCVCVCVWKRGKKEALVVVHAFMWKYIYIYNMYIHRNTNVFMKKHTLKHIR